MAINSVNNLAMTDKADASKPPAKRWVYVIPVAVVMYMLAYLDRTNTAMILPYINSDTYSQNHLTKPDEGIVSGIYFFGYMFLQIPAAILAERWSAKKTVAILMFLWGFAAMAVSLSSPTASSTPHDSSSVFSKVAYGPRCSSSSPTGSRSKSVPGPIPCGCAAYPCHRCLFPRSLEHSSTISVGGRCSSWKEARH